MKKIAILLSGLQRNYEPFIKNQLKLLINNKNLNYEKYLFISTSNENSNRVNEDGNIYYLNNKEFENNKQYFFDIYGDNILKDVVFCEEIDDFDRNIYKNEYISRDNFKFVSGLIKSYLKIYLGLELIEQYEIKNNINFDYIFRMRMDGFFFKNVNNCIFENLDNNEILCSKNEKNYKDDSCFIINRNNTDIIKNFYSELLTNNNKCIKIDENNNIIIEQSFINYCKYCKLKVVFLINFVNRIGSSPQLDLLNVPYFLKKDVKKLISKEYNIIYNGKKYN